MGSVSTIQVTTIGEINKSVMTDERILAMAAGYATWFAGVPDTQVLRFLNDVRADLQAEFAETFGPDLAPVVTEEFVKAVWTCRREIEAGAMPRALN
jgi:hypothetical protein